MAPLCEGICRRRRLRGVSKGNTQKNHSHSRTFETAKDEVKAPRKHNTAKKESTPVINNVAASTTLGDLDALAELKAKMEKGE